MAARRCPALCLVGLLFVTGCGLSDYQKNMAEQEQRVEEFDRREAALAGPVELPPRPVDDAPTPRLTLVSVFLRPPKGFNTQLNAEEGAYGSDSPLYRYGGPYGQNLFLAANTPPEKKEEEPEAKKADTAGEFVGQAWVGLKEFARRAYQRPVSVDLLKDEKGKFLPPETVKVEPPPWDGDPVEPLVFYRYTFTAEDKSINLDTRFQLYLSQRGDDMVAIVYQFPTAQANDPQLKTLIRYSLESFAVGVEADRRRQQFQAGQARG